MANAPHRGFAITVGLLSPFAREEQRDEDNLGYDQTEPHDSRFAKEISGRKVSKAEANYRPMEACGCCAMFLAPNRCSKVAGEIDADDLCDLFERSDSDDDGDGGAYDHSREQQIGA